MRRFRRRAGLQQRGIAARRSSNGSPPFCRAWPQEWEILLVNDGSRDRSWDVVRELAARYPRVRGIRMMRNFGQHNALLAGIRAARYAVTITMDDDLQHQPEEIPKLLAKLADGADVVYGTPTHAAARIVEKLLLAVHQRRSRLRHAHRHDRRHQRLPRLSHRLAPRLSRVQQPRGHHRRAALVGHLALRLGEMRAPAARASAARTTRLPKLFNSAMFILTGYSTAPLRLASSVGFCSRSSASALLAYVLGRYFITGGSVPGFPFLASAIAIFSGAQLFALGIIGEYLARIFNRSVERPVYVVKETTGARLRPPEIEDHDPREDDQHSQDVMPAHPLV